MNPFDLPFVVLKNHLFPALDWDDLLCIRRVCNSGEEAVAEYLKVKPELVPEITIGDVENRLSDFLELELDIPIRKLSVLNTSFISFYYDQALEIEQFLTRYGSGITHLRLLYMGTLMAQKELDFLKRLDHLEVLIAENWLDRGRNSREIPGLELIEVEQYHSTFLRLKSLELNEKRIPRAECNLFNFFNLAECYLHVGFRALKVIDLMVPSDKLVVEKLRVPFIGYPKFTFDDLEKFEPAVKWLQILAMYFETMGSLLQSNSPPFRTISFEEFYYFSDNLLEIHKLEEEGSQAFLNLAKACYRKGVTLERVNANWFVSARLQENLAELGSCIKSLVNIHPSVVNLIALENLEGLTVFTSRSCVKPSFGGSVIVNRASIPTRPAWPLLKRLTLVVDSEQSVYAYASEKFRLEDGTEAARRYKSTPLETIEFLFKGVIAHHLKKLRLLFAKGFGESMDHGALVDMIVQSCPNLENLDIRGWAGNSRPLAKFWEGLSNLKMVSFEDCENLENVAFVGEILGSPSFHCLKNLETLRLVGLDKMPKITDVLFRHVLRHMPLKSLIIFSTTPVKSITMSGVRQLQNGPFAGSISKFPFRNWSIDNCPEEEWTKLSKEFRSYYRL